MSEWNAQSLSVRKTRVGENRLTLAEVSGRQEFGYCRSLSKRWCDIYPEEHQEIKEERVNLTATH